MSMELIDGANLRKLIQRSIDLSRPFPINVACFIAMEMAKGLAYAHEKSDAQGNSLGIVHRDVSPPNVLISRQGEVKITDFGLAKAKSNVSVSDQDVVKGKFAYLSPEVVDGKEPDARADIYSVGIILWEMLCGRRLFVAKNDMETVELVRKGDVPKAGGLRPEIDEDLDKLLQRALAKNIKRRFQSCREVEQDLAGYLAKRGLRATAADLALFVRELLDDAQSQESLDVGKLLRHEMDELGLVGQLDLTVGQVPLKPSDLKSKSVSRFGVGKLLDRLDGNALDELVDQSEGGGMANLLEPENSHSQAAARIKKPKSKSNMLIIAGVAAVIVIGAVVLFLSKS
jgi:serine/threonine-protein kinase